jgi:hypothetical protein
MQILGHKNIKNILLDTQLVDFKDDKYVSKDANNVEEALKLVETGFDYVYEVNGYQLFRKRK